MQRFQPNDRQINGNFIKHLLFVVVFCTILCIFVIAINTTSAKTNDQQEASLVQAINKSMLHCYAVEGFYPDSFSYLTEHYGIDYDKNTFMIYYTTNGSNLKPDVTVIRIDAS